MRGDEFFDAFDRFIVAHLRKSACKTMRSQHCIVVFTTRKNAIKIISCPTAFASLRKNIFPYLSYGWFRIPAKAKIRNSAIRMSRDWQPSDRFRGSLPEFHVFRPTPGFANRFENMDVRHGNSAVSGSPNLKRGVVHERN